MKRCVILPVMTITKAIKGNKSNANLKAPHEEPKANMNKPAIIADLFESLRKALEKK